MAIALSSSTFGGQNHVPKQAWRLEARYGGIYFELQRCISLEIAKELGDTQGRRSIGVKGDSVPPAFEERGKGAKVPNN